MVDFTNGDMELGRFSHSLSWIHSTKPILKLWGAAGWTTACRCNAPSTEPRMWEAQRERYVCFQTVRVGARQDYWKYHSVDFFERRLHGWTFGWASVVNVIGTLCVISITQVFRSWTSCSIITTTCTMLPSEIFDLIIGAVSASYLACRSNTD